MTHRTYEQMYMQALERLASIRDSGENPDECHFLVTPYERAVLLDRPPFYRPERDLRDLNNMRFCGMRITVANPASREGA